MPERSTFGGGHPDPETLAAYADEALDDRATAEVERHIAECEECYELVTEVLRATAVEEPVAASAPAVPAAEVVPFVRRRIVVSIMAALVGAATMFLAVWTYRSDSRSGERMAPLVAAVRGTRYFEGRLSNGFEYAELPLATRGAEPPTSNLALLAAAGELQKLARADTSPATLHAWGVAQLLLGQRDEAISTLEQAAASAAPDARLQNDLAVAFISRASTNRASDWPKALEAAERASSLDRNLLEALFNRAFVLEQLGLREAARTAWQQYLERDSSGSWADYGRRRLAALIALASGSASVRS